MYGNDKATMRWNAGLREDSFDIIEATMWLDLIVETPLAVLFNFPPEEKKRILTSLLVSYPIAIADIDPEPVKLQLSKEVKLHKLEIRHQSEERLQIDFENFVRFITKLQEAYYQKYIHSGLTSAEI